MQNMNFSSVLLTVFMIIVIVLQSSSLAMKIKKSYIVYLGGLDHEFEASQIENSHFEFLGSILGSKERVDEALIYSYNEQFNGFAAILDEEDAAKIAEHPDVLTVIQNKGMTLHTTRSWDFLLENVGSIDSSSLWTKANYGENIIIANLDTGAWPESKSFSGNGYGPVPSKWKGGCENQTSVPCNNKLIGAKYYNKGNQAAYGKMDPSKNNARDHHRHGSHTLSTAGGNFVPHVIINGIGMGTAKGGSPKARVAAYKVCWPHSFSGVGCHDTDVIKGFETAINDGVDVISASLGLPATEYIDDPLAIASFQAVKKGIPVVVSAGNDGPIPGTVRSVAPWVITIGASTIDREFQAFVLLGSGVLLMGLGFPKSLPRMGFALINAANAKAQNATMMNAMRCDNSALDWEKVKGKVLVCLRGGNSIIDKVFQAALAGAAAMILCNDEDSGDEMIAAYYLLQVTHITYADGLNLYAYLNSTKPLGYMYQSEPAINIKPAPCVAEFSSRGPNSITPEILKPDIIAPGVNIIATYTEDETPYKIVSGTSMSCPHVAGVVGLLKSLHPDWSPSAIKSAIMTTATILDNTGYPMMDETKNVATPFSRGAGHIDPNGAMNPGLVYDLTVDDYIKFLCTRYSEPTVPKFSGERFAWCPLHNSILDFNYPSISVHQLNGTVTVTRRLTNVGPPGTYSVAVRSPAGILVAVNPIILSFRKKGEVQKFELTMKADGTRVIRGHVFGELVWSNGMHYHVKSPIICGFCGLNHLLVS